MEIRVLRYFLAVAREGSLSAAAAALHVTQPTLSRQLSALEDELGRQLYVRSKNGIMLTDQGVMLKRYAESIVALSDKAVEELSLPAKSVTGSVHIAGGEAVIMRTLARAMDLVRADYPGIDFQLYSGTSADLMDGLVRGQYDFFMECELQPHVDMHTMPLSPPDIWGLVIREDNPLAQLERITPRDLEGQPIITSRQASKRVLADWAGESLAKFDIVATYNLPLNGKFLVQEGMGSMFTYESLMGESPEEGLCFRRLSPQLESHQGIVWRKTMPTKQAQVFLDKLLLVCGQDNAAALQ